MSFLRREREHSRQLPPPTQDHVPVREVRGPVIIRHDGALVAVLGVQALNLSMLAPAEQARVIAAYDHLIKSLPFGWQTLIIARPQDVAAHLQALREQAAAHEQAGHLYHRQLLLSYIDFLNQLAWDSLALVRDYRLVVVYRHPSIDQMKERFGGKRVLTAQLLEEGRAELEHRVQQLQAGLRQVGLDSWVLSGPALKHELYLFYHPALQAEPLDLAPAPGSSGNSRRPDQWRNEVLTSLRARWRARREPTANAADVPREQVEAGQAPLSIGERTLLDDVAPGALEVRLDHFAFSHAEFGRVWFVEDFPPTMPVHGMEALYRFPAPIQVCFFSHPMPPEDVRRRMRQEITAQEAARLHRQKQGELVDYAEEATTRDALATLEEIEAGRTPYFFLSLYVLLLAPSKDALDKWSTQLEDVFKNLGLRAHRALARQEDGLLSMLPLGLNRLSHVRNMTATAQAHLFPFSSRQYLMPGGMFYGLSRLDGSLVVLDDFQMDNANAIVVGKQGSGKSVFLKQRVEWAVLQGARCYVVDIEGEYRRQCEDLGGVYINLAASGDETINVLDVDPDDPEGFIGAYYNFLGWLQVAVGNLTAREKNTASDAYVETMARAGIHQDDPATWRQPAPLLADYHAVLETRHEPEAQDLAARLKQYAVGLLAPIFNAPTSIDPDNPLVVFGLPGIREDLLPVRIWQIMSFVWSHVLQELHPTYFIVDEAWHLLQEAGAVRELAAMARRFRKKYAGLVLATQHAADLARNVDGQTIRDTAATVVLFGQEAPAVPLLQQLFGLHEGEVSDLLRLTPGQALLLTHRERIPIQVPVMAERWELFTTTAKEVAALAPAHPGQEGGQKRKEGRPAG